jgi:hypothetical protein
MCTQLTPLQSRALLALSWLFFATSAAADSIELNTGLLQVESANARALAVSDYSFIGKRLFLLQFPSAMRDAWMSKLQATGAQVLNAIPHNAYLIYADAQAVKAVEALVQSGVASWLGHLSVAAKLQPSADSSDLNNESVNSYEVQMVRDPQANAATRAFLAENGARIEQSFDVANFHNIVVQIQPARLSALLERADVISVNLSSEIALADERQAMIIAGEINIDNEPNNGNYLQKLAQWGFTQQQFNDSALVVDVADLSADRNPIGPDPGTMPHLANAGPGACAPLFFLRKRRSIAAQSIHL